MRKITFLTFLMASTFVFSQISLPIDYENGTTTASFQFGDLSYANIANPDTNGNSSDRVLQVDKPAGSEWFGGFGYETPGQVLIDLANGTEFTLKIWSTKPDLKLRFQIQGGLDEAPTYQRDVVVAIANQWTEVSFDFANQPSLTFTEQYSVLVIQPDYDIACEGGGCGLIAEGGTYYFDDIVQVGAPDPTCDDGIQNGQETGVDCGGPDCPPCTEDPNVPSVAAPTPTLQASDVISMFSDAYTDVPVDTWRTSWSNATLTDLEIAGNPTKRYTALVFNGIETIASPINATATDMEYFHMDIWSPNITTFRVKLVDFRGDGFQGPNGDTEAELTFTIPQSQWFKLDIPLANFAAAGMTDFSDLSQYIISTPNANGTVYVDNVYFSKVSTLSISDVLADEISVFPNPSKDTWTINTSTQNITNITVFDILGKQVISINPDNTEAVIDASNLRDGLYLAKISTVNGSQTVKLIKN